MTCDKVQDLLEEYIMRDLDRTTSGEIEQHLRQCKDCRSMFHETKKLADTLKDLPDLIKLKNRWVVPDSADFRHAGHKGRKLSGIVAAIFFFLFVSSSSLLAFPSLAEKYVPSLPIVQNLTSLRSEVEALKAEVEKNQNTELRVIDPGERYDPGLSPEENARAQRAVLDFVKAQYRGDLATIKGLASPELYKLILKEKDYYIFTGKGSAVFGQITNVAKEGEAYMVFVRISDDSRDNEYQENFNLTRSGDKFIITGVGIDA